MKKDEFVMRLKRKLGGEAALDMELGDKVFNMKVLEEKPDEKIPKPKDIFPYKQGDYCYDLKAAVAIDIEGRPIIEYYEGNALPIIEKGKVPRYNDKILLASIVQRIFSRGEAKSAIASTQKEPQKLDRMGILIGALMGLMGGMMLMIVLYPHIFH